MRRLFLLIAALATVTACGGDSGTTPTPLPVAITFKVDAQTCHGTASINFFIDGSVVGTETITAGGSSKTYSTSASTHVLGAQTTGQASNITWGPYTKDLTGLGTFTQVLTC